MKWAQGIDKLGLSLYFLLCGFAVANIYSVDQASGTRQAVWLAVSVFVGIFIFATRAKFFENMSGIIYIAGIVLLIGLFPFGTEILGQKNWYKFGPVSLQPVEFAKIGTALMLANYVSGPDFNLKRTKSLLTSLAILAIPGFVVLLIPDVGSLLVFAAFLIALFREGLSGRFFTIPLAFGLIFFASLEDPTPVLVALNFIACFILVLQLNKIKTTLPILLLLATVMIGGTYVSTISDETFTGILYLLYAISFYIGIMIFITLIKVIRREENIMFFLKSILIIVVSSFAAVISLQAPNIMEKLPKHQRERIEVLYKGEKAFRDTSGYNLLYSKTAIGSGGFLGKGYREGSVTQGKFVPEQSTDYIFCTVGEEWGFLGSSLLVICYTIFIGRIYYLSEKQKSSFNRVFGYSFASILLMHFSINLGMVMGLFPTVGIPLPFFSYGGSSLLAFSMMTFIFFKLNYTDRNSLV